MDTKLKFSSYFVLGMTLFALFFGAGNLIFPAELGQYAGENLLPAAIGFVITGVGLPLLGVLAIGFSGSDNLQDLTSRVHPVYAVVFTSLLYFTIGPFFAIPRIGAFAYDVGISPFIGTEFAQIALFIFTLVFFGVTLWLSLNPAKLVERIGKLLSPALVILLFVLLIMTFLKPIGTFGSPEGNYVTGAFVTGFKEGYNTMDALASLVFAIIIIDAVKRMGVKSTQGILSATIRAGIISVFFLGAIYLGIAYLGATSTGEFGLFETGAPVLSHAAAYYFGTPGMVLLAVLVILACLTTSIGLITACGEYFHKLLPKISYKAFVFFFTLLSFSLANFGLANIIKYSVPMLMYLYPLAIVIILLAFVSPLFYHARLVYVSTIAVTFLISIIDGLKAFCDGLGIAYYSWMTVVIDFYDKVLPLYEDGLGWVLPVFIVMAITGVIARLKQPSLQTNTH